VKFEIFTTDEQAPKTVETIMKAAKTGRIGDGKVFVLPLGDAFRIRTEEHGDAAI
jgi:nitrogen regulatory protein P-II 1